MPASASRRPSSAGSSRLSIGQVLAQLRDEFPDLAHSKLHYLEAEGLISPERTSSGYRKYSRDDVERLRFVLRAQRDRFWPLKVIKEHLLEYGHETDVTSIASRPGPSAELKAVRLDRRGLQREAGIDDDLLCELEQYGLIGRDQLFYGNNELEIARAARELAAHGLQPRHLVMLRSSAEREAHMIRSVAGVRSRAADPAARGEAQDAVRDLGEEMITLHSALLRERLRDC